LIIGLEADVAVSNVDECLVFHGLLGGGRAVTSGWSLIVAGLDLGR
jgi:hypothetical protein